GEQPVAVDLGEDRDPPARVDRQQIVEIAQSHGDFDIAGVVAGGDHNRAHAAETGDVHDPFVLGIAGDHGDVEFLAGRGVDVGNDRVDGDEAAFLLQVMQIVDDLHRRVAETADDDVILLAAGHHDVQVAPDFLIEQLQSCADGGKDRDAGDSDLRDDELPRIR